jgi:hypothetical protein
MAKVRAGEQISLRVPAEALRRADQLVPKLVSDQTLAAVARVTRSTVLKLALMRGLDVLEREFK